MAGAARTKATLEDFLAIPEDGRFHELVDGVIVERPRPSFDHGAAQAAVGSLLRSPDWRVAISVDVLAGPNVFCPDVSAWRRASMPVRPRECPVRVRPDFVCEIVSPQQPNRDTVKKVRAYQSFGIPHYWLLDLRDGTLTVLRHSPDGYVVALKAERGEKVRAEPFDAIELAVVDLLGGE